MARIDGSGLFILRSVVMSTKKVCDLGTRESGGETLDAREGTQSNAVPAIWQKRFRRLNSRNCHGSATYV